jgi:hypothetical protein
MPTVMTFTPEEERAALQRFMDRMGLTLHAWAKAADVPDSTLRTYMTGRTQSLKSHVERKLAAAAGVSVDAMYGRDYAPRPKRSQVWVKGYLGAGNAIQHFEAMGENEGFYEVTRPPGLHGDTPLVAMEIRGGSMPPWRDGDVVYCRQRDFVDPDMILGEACMVELMDGGMLFKEVRRGYEPGSYNLLSWDGTPPLENVRLRRAMAMIAVVRKDQARL